jgi:lysophospholipase L1-like esterase
LLRIDKILESKPKKIFILIGINDLSADFQIQLCADNYKNIISKIRTGSPLTKIYIQSILPINNKFYRGFATNEKIRIINSKLQNLANEEQSAYIDLFPHFINSEGNMDEKYSNDGLYLLGSGYLVWKSVIEKYVH